MPSFPNPVKLAAKGAGTAFQIGTFVVGQAAQRVQSLIGGDGNGHDATYRPTTSPGPAQSSTAGAPAPAAPRLEAVPGPKPTTSKTTATGPGGRGHIAPPAPKKKAATSAKPRPAAQKEIVSAPSTGGTKGETTTTVKATSRTGARSAGGRISNPKAAKKARARSAGASPKAGAGAGSGQTAGAPTAAAKTGDLSTAKGKGGRPATVKAENSPAEVARSKTGKQAAPMGADDK